jgi:hypothetical protein
MVFSILPANTESAAYEIDNSIRFDDGASSYVQRTAGANTGEDNATLSFWFKLGNIKSANNGGTIMTQGGTSGYHIIQLYAHKIYIGSANFNIMFPNLIRDPSAWYHLFIAFDSSQGTNTNRVKAYLNGVLLTGATGFTDYPDQNENLGLCVDGNTTRIGGRGNSGDESFDGYLAEFHFLDGTTKAHTDFGETNDNGVWIPKKYIGGSYGDNGFFLEFKQTGGSADASGLGADTSGEGHHFSGNNIVAATDITTDTPTNNFCTMNPLISFAGASDGIDAFTEGNTVVDSNNDTSAAGATFGVQNGKWYYEAKLTTGNQSSTNFATGWASTNYEGQKGTGNGVGFMSGEDNIAVDPGGNLNQGGTGSTSVFGNRSTNDIFQVALDLDNGKIHFGVNGTYSNGSATNSTTLDASNPDYSSVFDTGGEFYMPAFAQGSTGQTVLAYNFGNPAFAISSGNADANGYGNFEYAVPSGYYSLCTKNLAEFG